MNNDKKDGKTPQADRKEGTARRRRRPRRRRSSGGESQTQGASSPRTSTRSTPQEEQHGQRKEQDSRRKRSQSRDGERSGGSGQGRSRQQSDLKRSHSRQERIQHDRNRHDNTNVSQKHPEPISRGYEEMSEEQLTFLRSMKIDDELLNNDIPEYDDKMPSTLMDVVGVKLHAAGQLLLFDCQDMYFDQGNQVVVETGRGLVLGEVVVPARRRLIDEEKLPRVIRKATGNDIRQLERNRDKEDAAYRLCKDRIERLELSMKLIKVEYLHGGNKAVFYFSADGRIDFRELVRDLARRLHTRIEMRQIGVRDASRIVGGVGTCGCQLCCNLYLRDFQPVSIRMAKDQNLVLNPQKVSGICGRLLCCLTYEDEVYREAAKSMPKVGRLVTTPDGEGRIRDRDVIRQIVRIQLNDEATLKEYPIDKVNIKHPGNHSEKPEAEPQLDTQFPEDDVSVPES